MAGFRVQEGHIFRHFLSQPPLGIFKRKRKVDARKEDAHIEVVLGTLSKSFIELF